MRRTISSKSKAMDAVTAIKAGGELGGTKVGLRAIMAMEVVSAFSSVPAYVMLVP